MFDQSSFGLTTTAPLAHDAAVERITTTLADQGFGILTTIDLSGTMAKKLDKSMPPYTILGACHPPSAWDALQAEPSIGLLLPCNVVVTRNDADEAVIAAVDPAAMFQVVDEPGMDDLITDVRERLQRALDAVVA